MMTEEQIKTLASELSDEEVGKLILERWQYRLRQESKTTSSLPSPFVAKDPLPLENICQLLELFYLAYKDIAIDADEENPRSVEITLKLENIADGVLNIGEIEQEKSEALVKIVHGRKKNKAIPKIVAFPRSKQTSIRNTSGLGLQNHRVKWTPYIAKPEAHKEVALYELTEDQKTNLFLVIDGVLSELHCRKKSKSSKEQKEFLDKFKSGGARLAPPTKILSDRRLCRWCARVLPQNYPVFCPPVAESKGIRKIKREGTPLSKCASARKQLLRDLQRVKYKDDLTAYDRVFRFAYRDLAR